MSCFSQRIYRNISSKADRRLGTILAGTIRDELLSAMDERNIDDFCWDSQPVSE